MPGGMPFMFGGGMPGMGGGGAGMGGGFPGMGGMGGGMGGGGGFPGRGGMNEDGARPQHLYGGLNGKSKVARLTTAKFPDEKAKFVWFVEFYSAGCPHCQKAVPVVEGLAQKLEGVVKGIPLSYRGCYYGGENGAVQLLTFTSSGLLGEYENDFLALLNGLGKGE